MLNKNYIKDIAIASLVFLPSLVPVPLIIHLLLIPFVLTWRIKLSYSLMLLGLICILSLTNQIFFINKIIVGDVALKYIIPYSFYMIVSYFFAINANKRILKIFVFFVSIEILVGILEFYLGVHSIFSNIEKALSGEAPFGAKGLLYYSRVAGLSSNSSVLAMKILGSLMIVYFLRVQNKKKKIALYIFLALGLTITFTRSVILAAVLFIIIANLKYVASIIIKALTGKSKWKYISIFFVSIVGVVIAHNKFLQIINQLNRGRSGTDLSGRDLIFSKFNEFISNNFWFGNGSYKLWINVENKLRHAHNVYLQTLSTNGIIITILFFLFIVININKQNIKYVFPILILSLFQYAIFWGISSFDLIFFTFLLMAKNKNFVKRN